jgi:hypothetical protein
LQAFSNQNENPAYGKKLHRERFSKVSLPGCIRKRKTRNSRAIAYQSKVKQVLPSIKKWYG